MAERRERSLLDRVISVFSSLCASIPEFALGVFLIAAGIMSLSLGRSRAATSSILFALTTGLIIACYSTVDSRGVKLVEQPVAGLGLVADEPRVDRGLEPLGIAEAADRQGRRGQPHQLQAGGRGQRGGAGENAGHGAARVDLIRSSKPRACALRFGASVAGRTLNWR